MINRNAYLGLLLLTLASTSSIFAAREGKASARRAPVAGERRPGLFCCLGAARGLSNVAETLQSGTPATIQELVDSFLDGFSGVMFMEALTRSGEGEEESKSGSADVNPMLYDKLMADIIKILGHHQIRTADIHTYLAKNGNPAVASAEEAELLTNLRAKIVPEVEATLTLYAANLRTHKMTAEQIAAIAAVFNRIETTPRSESALWVEAEPFIQPIARTIIRLFTSAPSEVHKAWEETSNRSLVSIARTTSLETEVHSASARSVTTGAAKDDDTTADVEVRIDPDRGPGAPVAPKPGWCCFGRKPKA